MAELTVLHIKEDRPGLGPHIRMCTDCGTRLWLVGDGVWTEERSVFNAPPEGYINCREAAKQRSQA